jgi:hypothetical protein
LEESWNDKNNWWNKIPNMSEDEIDTLPNEYIRKFGSYIFRVQEMQKITHTEVNKDLGDMYEKVR